MKTGRGRTKLSFNPTRFFANSNIGLARATPPGGNMSRYLPVLLMGMILAGGHLVSAQVTTATISGVVQDSSGAVIPGVSIAVKNIDTGVSRTITTDEGGRYSSRSNTSTLRPICSLST